MWNFGEKIWNVLKFTFDIFPYILTCILIIKQGNILYTHVIKKYMQAHLSYFFLRNVFLSVYLFQFVVYAHLNNYWVEYGYDMS